MSAESNHDHRPSFRFRDKFSRLKDRVKDKLKDKTTKHNINVFVHENFTSNNTDINYSQTTRHGFRQSMHHFKDVLKNKTHYESIKHRIKDKIDDKLDLHDNKTYPKGFYDSLFSPETENEVYLKTAIICLWIIAIICIIPTIIVIFVPAKRKKAITTSANMIFFHVFLCELFYLMYILLAIINVAKDFRLASFLCDFANYGMYVTIPVMQFALLFLTIERLSKHFDVTMTWMKIFTKPFLIQLILCVLWIILIALLFTFMFIKKQFSFNFVKDKIEQFAPPLLGDVVTKLASRRHHCSVDGRLSSVFQILIIILFIILIVKPIIIALSLNLITPYCCKNRRQKSENYGDRRTTTLVTIFLLLNLFFSFPFYITLMLYSVLKNIDSTKDRITLILKICFMLRLANIIFECLAFYIFERNSWSLLSKCFYYMTCKKIKLFNTSSDDDVKYTRDPDIQEIIDQVRASTDEDDQEEVKKPQKKKRLSKKKSQPVDDDDDEDDGSFKKAPRKQSQIEVAETPVESDDDEKPASKRKGQSRQQTIESDEDEEDETRKITSTKRKTKADKDDDDDDDEEDESEQMINIKKQKPKRIQQKSDNDDDEEEEENQPKPVVINKKRKSQKKKPTSDEEVEEIYESTKNTRRKSRPKPEEEEVEEEDEEEEEQKRETARTSRRKSRPKPKEEEHEITRISRRKSRPKSDEEDETAVTIKKPKPHTSKSRRSDAEIQIPNGKATSHRRSTATNVPKPTKPIQRHSTPAITNTKRRSTQQILAVSEDSEADTASNASHASSKLIKPSSSPKPIRNQTHLSSHEQKRTRNISPNDQRSRHRKESSPSSYTKIKPTISDHSHHTTKPKHSQHTSSKTKKSSTNKKKTKKDRQIQILEMSHDV